jgi:hypothetical protein
MNNRYLEKIASNETDAEILKKKPSAGAALLGGALGASLLEHKLGRDALLPVTVAGLVAGAAAKSEWRKKHKDVEYRNPGAPVPERRAILGGIGGTIAASVATPRKASQGVRLVSQLAGLAGGAALGYKSGTKAVDKYIARKNHKQSD